LAGGSDTRSIPGRQDRAEPLARPTRGERGEDRRDRGRPDSTNTVHPLVVVYENSDKEWDSEDNSEGDVSDAGDQQVRPGVSTQKVK
jgi:hypothetical protein